VALGVAAAVKPWAVAFTPVAAAAPGRARWGRVLLALALAGATWVPFVLAEPATLDTSRYTIENEPASALRALGVDSEGTPSWGRPAQLLLGTLVAALLVR